MPGMDILKWKVKIWEKFVQNVKGKLIEEMDDWKFITCSNYQNVNI